ncbi:MAG: C25 family peptidase propeptide domain-containing protein, partial [Bacteroidota bacterium]
MKKFLTTLLFLLFIFQLSAQVSRNITDKGRQGVALSYSFSPAVVKSRAYKQNPLVQYTIKDFCYLREAGKPALPVRYELLLIPAGAQATIQMKPSVSYEALSGMIYPALRPATDRVGDPEPEFIMDSAFYQTNAFYPERAVDIVRIIKIRGLSIALIRIRPLQYNPKKHKIRFFDELNFTVDFKEKALSLLPQTPVSTAFLQSLQNVVLNAASLKAEMSVKLKSVKTTATAAKNYIIITHNDYLQAADSLAKWKSQLGYLVQIVSRSNWTSAQVKSEINSLYL